MRGNRDRTAFQHKSKKFQQIFIQGLGPNHNLSNSTLSYCNINDIPTSSKEMNQIPDYNTLIDLQMQLKREQQKIEEKIRSELQQNNNFNYNMSSGTNHPQKQFYIRHGTAGQEQANLGIASPSPLQILEMSPQPLHTSHLDPHRNNSEHNPLKQQYSHKKRQHCSGTLSSLTLSGKPVLLEQLSFSIKKQKINNQIALASTIQATSPVEERKNSARIIQVNSRSMTPKKKSSYNIPQMNTEMIINGTINGTQADDNNSLSELSPKLLHTVQMRHGCEVEIKEEVIHENNLSMDFESVEINSSNIQDQDQKDTGNHITIIGQESVDPPKKHSYSNKTYGQSHSSQAIYQQHDPTQKSENSLTSTLPLQFAKPLNTTMMSKQHCNSTSLILNLQQTAIIGTKLTPGLPQQPILEQQQPVSQPNLNTVVVNKPSPKKYMHQQLRSIYPTVNQKFVNLLPPLKKATIQTIVMVPPADPNLSQTGVSLTPNVPSSTNLKNKQKQVSNGSLPIKPQQLRSSNGSTSNIIFSVVQMQTNGKQNKSSKNNNETLDDTSSNDKILQKNSSQNKINTSHQKTFSRTSYNNNNQPSTWVNVSNASAITSITASNQTLKHQPLLQQHQIPVPPPAPKNNNQSINKRIVKGPESQQTAVAPSVLLSNRQGGSENMKSPNIVNKQQPANNQVIGPQRKIQSLAAQRGPIQNINNRKQSPLILKKESSFFMATQPSSSAVNRSTVLLPKPPIPSQTQLISPSRNRISILNSDIRPSSKRGLLSGERVQVNFQQASSSQIPKAKQNSLNQTFNKYGGKSKSIGFSELKNAEHQQETNNDFHARANQVDRQNRYIEQQSMAFFGSADDTVSSSSEESDTMRDPEEVTNKLKEVLMNDDVIDFGHYITQQIQKKRERLIKNSFSQNLNSRRQGPNNTSYYDHIGYCPADTTDKFRIHGTAPIDSTRASSGPESSDGSQSQPVIFKCILRDQLRIFDDQDLEQIIEQAQQKNYPIGVLAKQWSISEPKKGTLLYGKESNQPNEIASQTKIMTSFVVMKLVEELEIFDLKNYYLRVTKKAEKVIGTKAGLIEGQLISIYDCLHALMLPSGNDAAIVLATAFGKYLHFQNLTEKRKNLARDADEELKKALLKHSNLPLKRLHEASSKMDNKLYIQAFVAEMKRYSKLMKIDDNTNFTNPHGLSDKNNHSSPADVCKIASIAMKNRLLKDIVSRRYYECTVVSKEYNINLLQWFNSNKLINDYFIGIKTGTTPSAGPCLCGYFTYKDFSVIVCIMNTKTVDSRWKDMAILCLWALDKHLSQQPNHRESVKANDNGTNIKK